MGILNIGTQALQANQVALQTIGNNCFIGPNVVLHPGVVIGSGAYIKGNIVIEAGVKIDKDVVINDAYASIRADVKSGIILDKQIGDFVRIMK